MDNGEDDLRTTGLRRPFDEVARGRFRSSLMEAPLLLSSCVVGRWISPDLTTGATFDIMALIELRGSTWGHLPAFRGIVWCGGRGRPSVGAYR
ncbi:hypothetical protein V6N11_043138 [Hibiscus sabdariffa]|uniref:Uncharacterized protein n=1 Tax=Hibiscus sabdariffa TaxID=183260 RepID=A0ABR2QYD9_9ROSI